jgi:hypothetical protein
MPIELDDRTRTTILAALRFYQCDCMDEPDKRPVWLDRIATNNGTVIPLYGLEIDDLCRKLSR